MPAGHGINRERQVVAYFESHGWFAMRAPASLGVADVVALKAGHEPMLVEVKATAAGPFHSFGPADRAELLEAAERAGARPVLAWWPKRQPLTLFGQHDWPTHKPTD